MELTVASSLRTVCLLATGALAACSNAEPDSDTPNLNWTMDDLSAEQGWAIRVPEREVPEMHEEQSCYFVRAPDLNNGQDYFVDKVHMAMNPGSHHMNIFRVKTIKNLRPEDGAPVKLGPYDATVIDGHDDYQHSPCWDSSAWSDWPLVANTQHGDPNKPFTNWDLPKDVAMRFSPGEMLMVQTHYVNTSTQPTPGGKSRVAINLYRTSNPNPIELGTLFATQQSIRICKSNPTPVYSGACRFPGGVTVTAANGHFHSRGKEFDISSWDGQSVDHPAPAAQFYQSFSWDHPDMRTNIDQVIPNGGGVWWDCHYQWKEPIFGCETVDAKDPQHQNDCCYTFGGNTDVGEHCNVFLYYYPKVAAQDVFCN